MKLRYLSIVAAAALLAACSDAPTDSGNTAGGGVVTPPAPAPKAAPAGIAKGSKQDFITNVGDFVLFDFDKSSLTAEGKAQLDKQAAWLKTYPNYALTIEGRCDERGTVAYNLGLGERRANSVKEYLVAGGVAASRVEVKSLGKENPLFPGSDEESWRQNRRGVTVLK
jgi:peptidoglycan-associated lipoprotein